VDDALADILASTKSSSAPRRERDVSADVDKILSETLSGLEVGRKKPVGEGAAKAGPTGGPARQPAPPEAAADEAEAAPAPPPAPPRRRTGKAAPSRASAAAKSTSVAGAPPDSGTPPTEPPKTSPPPPTTPARGQDPDSAAGGARKEATKAPAARGATVRGTQFGQYVIEEHIATGGMAEVYKARMMGMEGFQKTVAIKRILSNLTDSDEFVRMFIDEAKLAAQLNHNNIIHIYDLGKVDRSHYIAMEFIEGRDLRSILGDCVERGVAIPIPVALHIASLLASALDYAHKKRDFENRELGLVHRDVSPQNVLISYEGDVKLCDFGIAKAASKVSQTRAGALKGKLQYMSPEQAWGKSIDHRSDIFSLGLVLYEMLTSKKVFSGDSELSVLEQVRDPIIAAPSSHNPEIGPEIDRIVFKALCADREDRYQSALDLQRDLEQVMRGNGWTVDHAAVAGLLSGLGRERSTPAKPTATAAPAGSAGGPPAPPSRRPSPPSGSVPQGPAIAPPATKAPKPSQPSRPLGRAGPDGGLERALSGGGGAGASGGPAVLSELSDSGISHRSRRSRPPWLLVAGVAAVVAAAGAVGWLIFGGDGSGSQPPPPVELPVATATETPVAESDAGLLTEEELIEQARVVAAAEIEKQEEALRERLEKEFPTPTPYPPTRTPIPTATPEPTATRTPTRMPPTPTRVPPTSTPIPPTATPAVREGDIVTLGPGVTPPVAIQQDSPEYPRVALRMGQTGLVQAEVLVGIDGRVEEFRVVTVDPPGFGFETATEQAAKAWRYRPATKHGVRVRMWVSVRVPFRGEK
jgi:TonB family protein